MKEFRGLIYLSLILVMMIYAVPQLKMGQGWTLPTIFSVAWLGLALLIVAAHLYDMMGVSEGDREELRRLQRLRRYQMEEKLKGQRGILQVRKQRTDGYR